MWQRNLMIVACLLGVTGVLPAEARDNLTEREIENLLAPVALYPDPLLDLVLDASQHPQALVAAGDFLNAGSDAKVDPSWPDSVKALLGFPTVLARLDNELSWTTRLGLAQLHQHREVAEAIQHLRIQARNAANLASDEHITVKGSQHRVEILPADSDAIWVPFYNPALIDYQHPENAAPFMSYVASGEIHHHHYYDHMDVSHFRKGGDSRGLRSSCGCQAHD